LLQPQHWGLHGSVLCCNLHWDILLLTRPAVRSSHSARQGTCGDSIPGASPPAPFGNCATDTLFNTNASNVQPANRENCCLATCANTDINSDVPRRFSCSPGFRYDPSAANGQHSPTLSAALELTQLTWSQTCPHNQEGKQG